MTGFASAALAIGVGTAAVGVYSANKAASAQESAARTAAATQQSMFDQTNANQAPYRAQGMQALSQLSQYYGLPGVNPDGSPAAPSATPTDYNKILSNLPGYQFQLSQGTQAIDRSQAARGLLTSGATGKALTQYGQGLAQSYAGQYTAGLSSIAGLGETATQATGNAGANAANQISASQIYAGNAAAQGDINTSNAITSAIGQGVGLYGMSNGGRINQPSQPMSSGSPMTYGGAGGGYNPNSSGVWSYASLTGQT